MRSEEQIFCDNLQKFQKNLQWFEKSLEKVKRIDHFDEESFELIESFLARFARTIDMFINKMLQGLDILELEDTTRCLDIVILAEKQGFVEDYLFLVELKNLRNELAYEYIEEEIVKKAKEVERVTSQLLDVVKNFLEYVDRYGYCGKRG